MAQDLNHELLIEPTSLLEKPFRILLVEDNPGDVILVNELLRSSGLIYSLKHVSTLKDTLLAGTRKEFDVVLLDLGLPDSMGLETLKKVHSSCERSAIVVMTGLDDENTALESLREGAQDYLVKGNLTTDSIIRGIKYGIERKKIEDLLRKNARRFSLLSATATAINECVDIASIFEVTCRNINLLLDQNCTVGIDLTCQGECHVAGIEFIEPCFDQIEKITGLNLADPVIRVNDQKKGILKFFGDGKLHKVFHKPGEAKGIQVYAIGFGKNKTIYGGVVLITRNDVGKDDHNIIETLGNQASLSIHRAAIEKDLKISENRYRKLSEELEMKVRERTRDLETSNYQLNQELIERHLAEEALKESEARLKELNATKDKFFNIIAHDLKNPFTSLLGSTELLNDNFREMGEDKVVELIRILNDAAKRGYAILQNLLDWSRSQTGTMTFNPEKINLKRIIDENISYLKLSSEEKKITLTSEVQRDLNILADRNMIHTVLRNLLGNGIKFTPTYGTVTVSATRQNNEATISVKDTGIGIPEDKINELFRIDTKFTRPGTNMEQGTGLGLKLCKEFVEMQGGKIWVKSTVNIGSEFIFTIPILES